VRVLFVASDGAPGGAELALETYLAHLPDRVEGHGLALSPGPVAARLQARLGRPVAVAGLAGRPGPAAAAEFHRSLLRLLRELRPDAVLATGIKAAALCAPAGRLAGVPVVWHKVDFSRDRLAAPLALLCAGVVPVSEAVGATVPAARRLPVVPPPVRLDPAFRVGPDRPPATLGSVGRIVPYKGHEDVIAAAGLLRDRFPEVRVVVAGAGPAEGLHAAAERARVPLEVLGHVTDVARVYERLTVLVQATYRDAQGFGREGYGLAAAEASWAGLPVIATTGGGGELGRLVPPRDPAAIAAAAARYLADPATARAAGETGARLARERLAPAPLAERLVAALASVSA
jgi:glycosyltransferase involved in cell wall biosynthesis